MRNNRDMIENKFYVIGFNRSFGNINRILDKKSNTDLISEPSISENFRLLIPTEKLEANYFSGRNHELEKIEIFENKAILRWSDFYDSDYKKYSLSIKEIVELKEDYISFKFTVENNTDYLLAEVWHSFIGGITGLGRREDTSAMIPFCGWSDFKDFFTRFPETMSIGDGTGMTFPEFYCSYPYKLPMPWIDIYNKKLHRGVYFACYDKSARNHLFRAELQPGIVRNRLCGNWPDDNEISERKDIFSKGCLMNWINFPYTRPGNIFKSPEVILRFHDGDWHRAAKIYRKWFISNFNVRDSGSGWLHKEQAVQASTMLLPEGNIFFKFKDIPDLARDAREFGINTILLIGWNNGGWDRGYPDYLPDTRLGTLDELENAIRKCHEIGVKVIMFANLHPVDSTTKIYKDKLHKYQIVNKKGMPNIQGWGMGTISARIGYTKTPLIYCDVAFPEFRKILVDHFKNLARIGIDGLHLDKANFWPEFAMDFNKSLKEFSPDRVLMEGLIECIEEILDECQKINPEFCISGEFWWDRLLSYCDGWWNWHDMINHTPVMKYTFPEYLPNFTVVNPWDYNEINNAIRYGYQILVGPDRYTATLKDEKFKTLSKYFKEIILLREKLKETIFHGEFLDDQGIKVESDEKVGASSFRNRNIGNHACILVNFDAKEQAAKVDFPGSSSRCAVVYQPFNEPHEVKIPCRIDISPERLAIVVEKP